MRSQEVLNPHIPPRLRRTGQARKTITMHPADYETIATLADELDVSVPDAVMTLYNFYEVAAEETESA